MNWNGGTDALKRRYIVKTACQVLLGIGVLAFLCSIAAKLSPAHHLFGFLPIALWRVAMAFAVIAIALKVVDGEK